ncbi:hypothetical protein CASFOL_015679 [Castilleja foliolosa]|uniref:ubiquitinyl hydrolase 1 n=1 Tax=Castilleja foliolosa TaxID=1961234 RepID=A0ABD3DGG8_9LAMI
MGTLLYHEKQHLKLCALHCLNALLQAPVFSKFSLSAIASDLDRAERQVMLDSVSDDLFAEVSHNVSRNGDFSIQVLTKALEVFDLQIIPLDNPVAQPAQMSPDVENAYICHLHDHWFCLRKVENEWYNFDSMKAAPEHLSKFGLSVYLDSLKTARWSIFVVRGDFPKECPVVNGSNRYGRWMTPEEAKRINDSASRKRDRAGRLRRLRLERKGIVLSDDDDEDDDRLLKEAIAASLRESSTADEKQPDSSGNENENTSGAKEKQSDISENENVEKDKKKRRVEEVNDGLLEGEEFTCSKDD